MSKRLTVGMLTHNDFDGVFFSIQSILMHHKKVLDRISFVVVDNNPDSPEGKDTATYCSKIRNCHYSAVRGTNSTSLRNIVFEMAPDPIVVCMDSHVLIEDQGLEYLLRFYDRNPGCHDLLHGPLLDEMGSVIATGMLPEFRDSNFGVWENDNTLHDSKAPIKEIVGMGMGLFACTRDGWLRFTPGMRQFGGEELNIHEKYRLSGRKCLCLPFFKWVHRFARPKPVAYPLTTQGKARNILLSFTELGIPLDIPIDYYGRRYFSPDRAAEGTAEMMKMKAEMNLLPTIPYVKPPNYKPFMGKPIKMHD